ncbi:hypothetical protein H0H93_006140 [Arthromyces matolae]|nr:hypothetical protein H0H93_006140 [Arthromyces matolae]
MSIHIPTTPTDDEEDIGLSTTPTPISTLYRTISHGSQWSASDTPAHHNQGTSYYTSSSTSSTPSARSPPPVFVRTSSGQSTTRLRSTSRSSSHTPGRLHRSEVLSEEEEEEDQNGEGADDTGSISASLARRGKGVATEGEDAEDGEGDDGEDDPITLKERQSLINVQHPFGLPIWKPALYKKSRSLTRYADEALHSVPSAQAERHLLPGNIFWFLVFGWWIALVCVTISAVLYFVPQGGKRYAPLVYGLGWYLMWPFGKYVEGDLNAFAATENEVSEEVEEDRPPNASEDDAAGGSQLSQDSDHHGSSSTIKGVPLTEQSTITPGTYTAQHVPTVSWNSDQAVETTHLLHQQKTSPSRSYGTSTLVESSSSTSSLGITKTTGSDILGKICFWLAIVTVLLCTYRAVGLQYYKYTVGGVNILFINLLPLVFFVILDGMVLLPIVDRLEHEGKHVPALLAAVASRGVIFILSLLSVIPLSYFIGMAVASISAQSSIGMGAVINASFGSIIEIILYSIALTQGKGRLVDGSIIGSLLAGVLLMPGISMCSGALRHKEQRFNAKSAGVTSMMLIMAIIGALAPTLFYQTYGNFQLSYLIGLWFSLRTHASQIWQNPGPLLHHMEINRDRASLYHRLGTNLPHPPQLTRKPSSATSPTPRDIYRPQSTSLGEPFPPQEGNQYPGVSISPSAFPRRISIAHPQPQFSPILEAVNRTVKDSGQVPQTMSTDDFTRAVAVATVSALRHQQAHAHTPKSKANEEAAGGHDAPSWSRTTSASVLLACTALYAIIAELLVDVVDVILENSGIDEKFLGITLFALVPNTTEFMNAISFAINNNIALSMEIGSAYALQPGSMGEEADTFT